MPCRSNQRWLKVSTSVFVVPRDDNTVNISFSVGDSVPVAERDDYPDLASCWDEIFSVPFASFLPRIEKEVERTLGGRAWCV